MISKIREIIIYVQDWFICKDDYPIKDSGHIQYFIDLTRRYTPSYNNEMEFHPPISRLLRNSCVPHQPNAPRTLIITDLLNWTSLITVNQHE
jgi:hypothetical protein